MAVRQNLRAGALAVGLMVAALSGELSVRDLRLELATPVWVWPVWSASAALGLGVPLGGHGLNLAALMAAIASSPEAHPDRDLRYGAGVAAGLWFILFGLFGATAAVLFGAVPRELVAGVAGLAMLPALVSSLAGTLGDEQHREGGVLALLLAASDVTLLGIGAPFWALVLRVAVGRLFRPSA